MKLRAVLRVMSVWVAGLLLACHSALAQLDEAALQEAHRKAQHFIDEEKQFHLGALPTEQSNPKTVGLAEKAQRDLESAIRMLQSVDADVTPRASQVFASNDFQRLAEAMRHAIQGHGRICFSGCGATGRLSILLEAAWRQSWQELRRQQPDIAARLPDLEGRVVSIMTGGDYALIRSVENFEDHAIFGRRQVQEAGLGKGDVLVAISEGGETSSVIGTVWQAIDNGAQVFFVFNNPASVLARHVERSRRVIEDPRITKLDLCSGPMAVAGSTRMQATTCELLVVGGALELALADTLHTLGVSPFALADKRPAPTPSDYARRFSRLLEDLGKPEAVAAMAAMIRFEEQRYHRKGLVTYMADECLLDIFTDTTERSPTFMLPRFRKSDDKVSPPSWAFVKSPLLATPQAWRHVLRREPRCLDWNAETYRELNAPAKIQTNPPRLSAGEMLKFTIGDEDDPSRYTAPDCAAVLILVDGEAQRVAAADDPLRVAFDTCARPFSCRAVLSIGPAAPPRDLASQAWHVPVTLGASRLRLWDRLAAKLVLNTVSTATMARMGRLQSNWMTYVETTNKKLIDRGTRLVAELAGVDYKTACYALYETMEELARTIQPGDDRPSPVARTIARLKGNQAAGSRPQAGPVAAGSTEDAVVENAHLRLVFARRPVPFLRELVHKPSGTNLIAQPASTTLFTLQVTQPKDRTVSVESQQAKQGTVEVVRTPGAHRIVLQFAGLGPAANLHVTLEGTLGDGEPTVRWSIAVDNPSRLPLATVTFPRINAVPAIGSAAADFIVGPALPGVMIENPAGQWPANYSLSWTFPGEQSVQFCSYQDHTAGVYLASMDTSGSNRALRIAKREGKSYLLSQEYQLPDEPAAQWKGPYDTALGVTSGSWQHTADIYKRWAMRQPWCGHTLAERGEIPDAWKQGPCIHTVEVRTYGPERTCNGSYYPKLREHLQSFRERIDGPVVPMLAGWENHRRWTAGDYFPLFDAAHAKTVLPQIRHDGFMPFVYLSGLYYTFENEGRDGSAVPGWQSYANSLVIDRATGKPKTYQLNESSPGSGGVWNRHSYAFCPSAPGTKAFFRSVIAQLHALGIDFVQMDQTTTGAGDACYATDHGHAPGRGPYQALAFRELLHDLRAYGKSLSPQFVLLHEEPHEELIPCLDGFHTREYRERYWYRRAPGARGIPLFTYLYHEYAICYGGEGPSIGKDHNPNVVRELAVNLVTGKTPGASVWSSQGAMAAAHPDQIKMLRNHSRLMKTEAQRFLMLGRMLHPLEFDVPAVTLKLPAKGGKGWHLEPFEDRAVLTSSWQSPEGLVGHCLVNISDAKQTLHLQLDTRGASSWPKADVDLYRAEAAERQSLAHGIALPHPCTLELAPLEAAFLVLRPAK
jgi:N-acetylmuramic acid 6-phosphate etherase